MASPLMIALYLAQHSGTSSSSSRLAPSASANWSLPSSMPPQKLACFKAHPMQLPLR